MNHKFQFLIKVMAFAVLTLSSSNAFAYTPYQANLPIVPSNHASAISAVAYDENNEVLFTGSIDGTVKLWRSGSESIYYRFQLTSNPIIKLVAHPQERHFASIESTADNRFVIRVWDWERKRQVFTKTLTQEPIFIDYSPNGSYLSYAIVARNGLVFLNADNGRQLSYLNKPLGIISFMTYSSDEQRVMLYNAALGTFSYYNLSSGRQLAEINSVASLENLVIMPNRRHAVGIKNDAIVLLDVVSGEELDRLLIDNPQSLLNYQRNNINSVQFNLEGQNYYRDYQIDDEELEWIGDARRMTRGSFQFVRGSTGIYGGSGEGRVTLFNNAVRYELSQYQNLPISNLGFSGNKLFISTESGMIFLESSIFSAQNNLNTENARISSSGEVELPVTWPFGFIYSLEDLIVYDKSPNSRYYTTNGNLSQFNTLGNFTSSQIIQSNIYNDEIIALDNSDNLSIYSISPFERVFQYTNLGLLDAIPLANNRILIGKNEGGTFSSSLISVNRNTGETQNVTSSDLSVFELELDRNRNQIYSLAIREENNSTVTVLRKAPYSRPSTSTILRRFNGEDDRAHLVINQSSGTVYTSLGDGRITALNSGRATEFDATSHIPENLFQNNGLIYSINHDHSISVYHENHRDHLFDIKVFSDLSWVVLFPDGQSIDSENRSNTSIRPGTIMSNR